MLCYVEKNLEIAVCFTISIFVFIIQSLRSQKKEFLADRTFDLENKTMLE